MSGISYLHGIETTEIDNGSRPIQTVKSSVVGFVGTASASENDVPMNRNIMITSASQAAAFGPGSILDTYQAHADQGVTRMIARRVPTKENPTEQMAAVLGEAAMKTGVYGLRAAKSELGVAPRILSAPGFTGARLGDKANPVGAALKGIAERMRAVAIVDGPNIDEAAAIVAKNDYGSARVYMVDPYVSVFRNGETINVPGSAFASAAISKRDGTHGFWWSGSNTELNGVTGLARPIPFDISDKESEANLLNENGIATIVNHKGYRLWGQRSTSSDPNWAFLQVRRTADMIYESIEYGHDWAMDRPISRALAKDILEMVNSYLRHLKSLKAILGGQAWLDPELNTDEILKGGKLYINFDIEPPSGLEHLIFRAFRNEDYYEEVRLVDAQLGIAA